MFFLISFGVNVCIKNLSICRKFKEYVKDKEKKENI